MLISDTGAFIILTYTGATTIEIPFPFYGIGTIALAYRSETVITDLTPYTSLVNGTDFIVTGTLSGDSTNVSDNTNAYLKGTLTITSAGQSKLTIGDSLLLQRVTSIIQQFAYTELDNFPAKSHENALGRLTVICQELKEELGYTLQAPPGTPGSTLVTEIIDLANRVSNLSGEVTDALASVEDAKQQVADAIDRLDAALEGVEALEAGGIHVGTELYNPSIITPEGWLDESVNQGPLPRVPEGYKDLWAFAEVSGNILSDAAWLAQVAAQGACGAFSSGDGSTTFRIPFRPRLLTDAGIRLPIIKAFHSAVNPTNIDVAGLVIQLGITNDNLATTNDKLATTNDKLATINDEMEAGWQVLHVQDQKPSGTNGGAIAAGAWYVRDLNTVLRNTIPGASVSANKITLPAGTYDIDASAPAYTVRRHRIRFATDDVSIAYYGTSEWTATSSTYSQTRSYIKNRFYLTAPATFSLQHRVEQSYSVGLGNDTNMGVNEIFADVKIRRVKI